MGTFQNIATALVLVSLLVLPSQGRRFNINSSTEKTAPDGCSVENVVVYQSSGQPLPSGIPTYDVEILNKCEGCAVYNVHIMCGEFASTELVDPSQFRRVGENNCLVKNGGPMGPAEAVSFQYSNSFAYPLHVGSFSCH